MKKTLNYFNGLTYLVIYDYYDMPLTAVMADADNNLWYINLVDYDQQAFENIWLVLETTQEMMQELTNGSISHKDMILNNTGRYFTIKHETVTEIKKEAIKNEWLPDTDSYVDNINYIKEEEDKRKK